MKDTVIPDKQKIKPPFDYETAIDATAARATTQAKRESDTRSDTSMPKKGVCHWLMENHQLLSSVSVIIGLPATILAIVLTMNQMKSSKVNFEEEMAMQRRSTAAVLFNDFLKDVRALQTSLALNATPLEKQKEAEKLLAVQAEFILSGIGDTHIRSKLFSFLADKYGEQYLTGTPNPKVKTRGLSFDNGNVYGTFKKVLFEEMSFTGASIDGQFEGGFIRYTDFSNALFNKLKMEKTTISCSSMAGAVLSGAAPGLSGTRLSYVDFRGVTVKSASVTARGHAAALAAILSKADQLHEVRLDPQVERELNTLGRTIEYDSESNGLADQSSTGWFASIMENRVCDTKAPPATPVQPSSIL